MRNRPSRYNQVEQLRTENERLEKCWQRDGVKLALAEREVERLRRQNAQLLEDAEYSDLKAENERLREALESCRSVSDSGNDGVIYDIADRALRRDGR